MLADSRADYTNGGVTGLVSERAGSASKFYHADQLGSTKGITDAGQAVTDSREHDAFGLTIASAGSTGTPFGFVGGPGYQSDADSGLMLLGARYYDPSVGRFISRDPTRYGGGDVNLYRYCANDPLNRADPSGQMSLSALLAAALGALGAALLCGIIGLSAPMLVPLMLIGAGVAAYTVTYQETRSERQSLEAVR